jgi:hypothetical protein
MPIHTVTIDPSPLIAGKKGEILYDGPDGTEITLDWDPPPSTTVVIRRGKAQFNVPQNATSLIASDPWANASSSIVQQ